MHEVFPAEEVRAAQQLLQQRGFQSADPAISEQEGGTRVRSLLGLSASMIPPETLLTLPNRKIEFPVEPNQANDASQNYLMETGYDVPKD